MICECLIAFSILPLMSEFFWVVIFASLSYFISSSSLVLKQHMAVSIYDLSLSFWYAPIVQTDLILCLISVWRVTFFLAHFLPCLSRIFSLVLVPRAPAVGEWPWPSGWHAPSGFASSLGCLFLAVSDITSSASSCTGAHVLPTLLPLVFWHRPFGVWCSGGCLVFCRHFSGVLLCHLVGVPVLMWKSGKIKTLCCHHLYLCKILWLSHLR